MAAVWWLLFLASMAGIIGSCYVGGTYGLYNALGDGGREKRAFGWCVVVLTTVAFFAFLALTLRFGMSAMFGGMVKAPFWP